MTTIDAAPVKMLLKVCWAQRKDLTGVFQSNQLGSNPSRKKLMSMRQFIKSRASLVSVWITLVIMLLSITMP